MFSVGRLTDEESKRNWKEYGNPDGPKAAVFGIALPSWIVEKSNSIWVCLYQWNNKL